MGRLRRSGQLLAQLGYSGPELGRHALGRGHRQVAFEVLEGLLRLLVLHVDHPPEDERGGPVGVQVRDPAQLGHPGLPPSLDHLQEGAVDPELGAEGVRGERALVQLLRLLELAAADELADHLGGQGQVASGVVPGPGERGLEVLVVGSGRLAGTSAASGAGGGLALGARLLFLREPEAERAEEDDRPRSPGGPDELRVASEESARRRGRGGLTLLPLAGGLLRSRRHLVAGTHRVGGGVLEPIVLLLPGRRVHLVLLALVLAELGQERVHPALGIAHAVRGSRGAPTSPEEQVQRPRDETEREDDDAGDPVVPGHRRSSARTASR
jgi:hypothetical protein